MLSKEEIIKLIEDDKASRRKRKAEVGQRYYEGKHDILNYTIYYIDGQGNVKEDTYKSNIKIPHPFFTELVDQQTQYMLSSTDDAITAEDAFLKKQLQKYFDDDFWTEAYDLLTGTVVKGFDYLHAYTDKEGLTRFEHADGMGVIEVSEKDSEDHEKYVIYWYTDVMKKGSRNVQKIQVWDKEYIYFYESEEGSGIREDETVEQNPRKHTIYKTDNGDRYSKGFGFIPFFRLDNGVKQRSGLDPIKALIDDYDLMSCSLSNNLQDFTDALYIVSGYMGDNMDELIHNIKAKKHIGVDKEGGVDIKTVDIPHEARKAKMEIDEKNIYRFGMGFNSAQTGDGNITNIVIKSRYALLDMKCNKLELRLKKLLRKLLEVIIPEINQRHGKDYSVEDVKIVFDREIMTNASDNADIALKEAQQKQILIDMLLSISSVIPEEKVIEIICEYLDIDFEEIKDKLPINEQKANTAAMETIDGVIVDE